MGAKKPMDAAIEGVVATFPTRAKPTGGWVLLKYLGLEAIHLQITSKG